MTIPVATLSLFRFDPLSSIAFGSSARWGLPGCRACATKERALFWKLCGSARAKGSRPKPNWAVWAILAVWPDEDTARARVAENAGLATLAPNRAAESWTVYLAPVSRGRVGQVPFGRGNPSPARGEARPALRTDGPLGRP